MDLRWDGTVLYQSTRHDAYRELADKLLRDGLAYRCSCSRSDLRRQLGAEADQLRYPGNCRNGHEPGSPTAIRVAAPEHNVSFEDALQGCRDCNIDAVTGDYVIYRRDGLPAYHLAVVADDAHQKITHVVRGVDLLDSTPQHIHLQQLLALPTPHYGHVPVIVNEREQKLSKQTGAPPIDEQTPSVLAYAALRYLGLEPPGELVGARPAEFWQWARGCWSLDMLQGVRQIHYRPHTMAEPP